MNDQVEGRSSRLRVLDRRFGRWVRESFTAGDRDGEAWPGRIERLAAAVSHALHLKHGCLDLERVGELEEPELERLLAGIAPADLAGLPDDHPAISLEPGAAPLVRSPNGQRLWLQKYALFERTVAQRAGMLAKLDATPVTEAQQEALERLYPRDDARFDGQRQATELALTRHLAVITGGPGTGKTWTVAGIIGLLRQADPSLRIALAAPTGKAANRVMESLRQAAGNRQFADLPGGATDHGGLPDQARTLHALLEVAFHSVKPRRHRDHPLDCDVLIVDEASMVDLPMMARILDALPENGRLILLGDKDQLSSVEAGGVLADLCRQGSRSVYGAGTAPVAELTFNHRSTAAIQALAESVNDGAWAPPESVGEVRIHRLGPGEHASGSPGWLAPALTHHRALAQAIEEASEAGDRPAPLLGRLTDFQLLCALREGPAGVAGINGRLERVLGADYRRRTGRDPERADRAWFPGLPVMVLRNDHERRLYNGDVGLVLPVEEQDEGAWRLAPGAHGEPERLRACFLLTGQREENAQVKAISLAQMPPFESAFALTVHKSQGSEYRQVSFLLPDDLAVARDNPVLTRELLYTGITRAKQQLDLWAGDGVPEAMARRRTVRMSGLATKPGSGK